MKDKHKKKQQFQTLRTLLIVVCALIALTNVHMMVIHQPNTDKRTSYKQVGPPLEFRSALKPTDDFVAYQHWHNLDAKQ